MSVSNYFIVKVRLKKGGQWRTVGGNYDPSENVPNLGGYCDHLRSAKSLAKTLTKIRPDLYAVAVFQKGRIVLRTR